jgi:hypothetical protein
MTIELMIGVAMVATRARSRRRANRKCSRPSYTASARVRPHVPIAHTKVPGVCSTCNLAIITRADGTFVNSLHMTMDEMLQRMLAAETIDFRSVAAGDSG